MDGVEAEIVRQTNDLNQLAAKVPVLAVFGEDQAAAEAAVQALAAEVASAVSKTNTFCGTTRDGYSESQQCVPTDLAQKVRFFLAFIE